MRPSSVEFNGRVEGAIEADAGGWLWFAIDVIFVIILGGALMYGTFMWRRRSRNPTVNRIRDEVTKENYRHPGG